MKRLDHEVNMMEKALRASVIINHMRRTGIRRCVCFTCGNAAQALQERGADVLVMSTNGDMKPNRWFKQHEICNIFPEHFDATSGHLPMELMLEIAELLRATLGSTIEDGETYEVQTGSGETIVCLALAFPGSTFEAAFSTTDPACMYEEGAPLAHLVTTLFKNNLNNINVCTRK